MEITSDEIQEVIRLARIHERVYDEYESKYFPNRVKSIGDYIKYRETPEAIKCREASNNLEDYISNLEYEKVLDLESLMLFGREVFTGHSFKYPAKELNSTRVQIGKEYSNPDGKRAAADYIAAKSPLADYLESALDEINV